MRIRATTFWKKPRLICTLLSHLVTLDPTILFKRHELYVLEDRKKVYGFIALKYHSNALVERGSLYVYPHHRNKGYGKKLMKYVIKNHKNVYVLCKSEDKKLKEKQGFQLVKKAPFPLAWRRAFYNNYLRPLTGQTIIAMKK
ncbi:MAG: GNAT family N-acetyltransferase [Nanoarchaeota archaeon]